jgi:hypothetical protein
MRCDISIVVGRPLFRHDAEPTALTMSCALIEGERYVGFGAQYQKSHMLETALMTAT